jgi:hypothetical protein
MFNKSNIIIDLSDVSDRTYVNEKDINQMDDVSDIKDNDDFAFEKQKQILDLKPKKPTGSLIIVDNFYNNANDVRKYILTQEFSVKGNYPGQRTISYATEDLKNIIQKYVEPFAGKITEFPIPKPDLSDATAIYNGAFQYTISRDRSWIHTDKWNNWAGVLFLTPDAPLSAGTAFYRFFDGSRSQEDTNLLKNQETVDRFTQDFTKWELVDRVGNIYNRIILFNSHNYHMSQDYFGDTKENGRLFQVFFFSTER